MIIRHSKQILEQLSEIENYIHKIESYIDECGLDVDREKLLMKLLKNQEAMNTSRSRKKEN
jgi:hypothetical protein